MPSSRHLLPTLMLTFAVVIGTHAEAQFDDLPGLGTAGSSQGHVTWTFEVTPDTLTPGDEGVIIARYDLAPGWKIYSPDQATGGTGTPTVLKFAGTAKEAGEIEIVGDVSFPQPKEVFDDILEETFRTLDADGALRQSFRVPKTTLGGKLEIRALLTYQACDKSICDPIVRDAPHVIPIVVSAQQTHVELSVSVEPNVVVRGETAELLVEYEVADAWYMYAPSHKSASGLGVPFSVKFASDAIELVGEAKSPEPETKRVDDGSGKKETHRVLKKKGTIRRPFKVKTGADPGKIDLAVTVTFMACEDKENGVCDPPTDRAFVRRVEVSASEPVTKIEVSAAEPETQTIWGLILAMILGGLVALILPCTYPMIPITIAVFTKEADQRKGGVLPLAIFYGLGIVLTFNLVGLLASAWIIPFAQHWSVNAIFGAVFLIFALSFLDIFTLRLPAKLSGWTTMFQPGTAAGASSYLKIFFLGATLVITSFTCTVPIMGSLLAATVSGENASVGRVVIGMTAFGLTMAAPFVFLALFPAKAKSMPRSGEWMNTVKVFLGFLELAAAFKFFSNADLSFNGKTDFILTADVFLLIWAVIFAVAGLYLLNLVRLKSESTQAISGLRMLFGIVVIFLAAYYYECSRGLPMDWVTQALAPPPKEGREISSRRGRHGVKQRQATWPIVQDDLEKGLAAASEKGSYAMINFTGVT